MNLKNEWNEIQQKNTSRKAMELPGWYFIQPIIDVF